MKPDASKVFFLCDKPILEQKKQGGKIDFLVWFFMKLAFLIA